MPRLISFGNLLDLSRHLIAEFRCDHAHVARARIDEPPRLPCRNRAAADDDGEAVGHVQHQRISRSHRRVILTRLGRLVHFRRDPGRRLRLPPPAWNLEPLMLHLLALWAYSVSYASDQSGP